MSNENSLVGKVIGNYEILRELGRGGMGVVYKAHEMSLQRVVALKVLSESLSGHSMYTRRFQREAWAYAQLNHPNIVTIHAVGEQDGVHYIAMEYVVGKTLAQVIKEQGTLAVEVATDITLQVAEALFEAHGRDIIHRDIKPSNIMIDAAQRVRVMDFGLAKLVVGRSELTGSGAVLGTPAYMSPEQCDSAQVDLRTDIYSLGVVLFEMLTGRSPFLAETPLALMRKIVESPFPRLERINSTVPAELARIVQRMVSKKRARRYESCQAVIADIRAFRRLYEIQQEETAISPVPGRLLARRAATTLRMRAAKGGKVLVATLVGVLLVVIGIALGVSTLSRRAPDNPVTTPPVNEIARSPIDAVPEKPSPDTIPNGQAVTEIENAETVDKDPMPSPSAPESSATDLTESPSEQISPGLMLASAEELQQPGNEPVPVAVTDPQHQVAEEGQEVPPSNGPAEVSEQTGTTSAIDSPVVEPAETDLGLDASPAGEAPAEQTETPDGESDHVSASSDQAGESSETPKLRADTNDAPANSATGDAERHEKVTAADSKEARVRAEEARTTVAGIRQHPEMTKLKATFKADYEKIAARLAHGDSAFKDGNYEEATEVYEECATLLDKLIARLPDKEVVEDVEGRYILREGQFLLDTKTGLAWLRTDSGHRMPLKTIRRNDDVGDYVEYANQIKCAGRKDWRLPTRKEFEALALDDKSASGFQVSPGGDYWCKGGEVFAWPAPKSESGSSERWAPASRRTKGAGHNARLVAGPVR